MAKDKDKKLQQELDKEINFDVEQNKKENDDKKVNKQEVKLPVFLEVVFSFAVILTVLSALAVALVSFLSGAELIDIFIRTAVTILSIGILLWVFSLLVSNGAKQTLKALHQDAYEHMNSERGNQRRSQEESFTGRKEGKEARSQKE